MTQQQGKGGGGGWSQLSAEAKADRTARMLAARAKGRAQRAKAAQTELRSADRLSHALTKKGNGAGREIREILEVPAPSLERMAGGRSPGDNLDALASLIVAVWRKL